MIHRIDIQAVSVNECWRGRRFKTPKYSAFREEMLWILPNIELPDPPFVVYYEFGTSSKLSDWDNFCKPTQDALQERYGFNDRDIMEAHVKKVLVPKGNEYISFEIKHIEYD